jgi:hypothetical protein
MKNPMKAGAFPQFWRLASVIALVTVFLVVRGIEGGAQLQVLYAAAVALAMLSGAVSWVIAVAAIAVGLVTLQGLSAPAHEHLRLATEAVEALLSVVIVAALALQSLRVQTLHRLAMQSAAASATEVSEQLQLLRVASQQGRLGGWTVSLAERQVTWSDETARIHGMPAGFSPSFEDAIGFYAPGFQQRIAELFEACAHYCPVK